MESKQTTISVRISEELLNKVKEKTEANGATVSGIIKVLLTRWVNDDKTLI